MVWLFYAVAFLALLGLAQALVGWHLAAAFAAEPRPAPKQRTPVTVLKPLYGDEPLLEAALSSHCRQNAWPCQIVFGVQHPADAALAVVDRVRARFPEVDIAVVVDPAQHGPNRKIGNLINMLPAASHDLLVIADSDLHVGPDYLERIVGALEQPGCGLATTLYAGLPAAPGLTGTLGAMAITHYFLPGALLARRMGRQDCLGATMALRRETLDRIGGLPALVAHLADDHALGRRVRGLGLAISIAGTVPATTVPETRISALFRHELRWARTIRALEPAAFAGSFLQFPLVWAAMAILLSGGAIWAVSLFAAAWALRGAASRGIDRALTPLLPGLAFRASFWLVPLRELMSVVVMIASYGGHSVDWRGHTLHADGPVSLASPPPPISPQSGP
jgi:ceramide glucosyltransferase